jgi:NhaP-type Na+/H+ or K+/H+ antiporter
MEYLTVQLSPDLVHIYLFVFGAFTFIVGSFGKPLKVKFSLSEPLLALALGSILGPSLLGWLGGGDVLHDHNSATFMLEFTRAVIAVQVSQ